VRLDLYQAETARIAAEQGALPSWNAIIGLRNRIVHDYMNVDMARVIAMVEEGKEEFVVRFLLQPA